MDEDERAVYDARFQALQDQIDDLTATVRTVLAALENQHRTPDTPAAAGDEPR